MGKYLLKGVGSTTAKKLKVNQDDPSKLWRRVAKQLPEEYTLSANTRKISGRLRASHRPISPRQ